MAMTSKPAALLVATMDTKGREAQFIAECLGNRGLRVVILDAGIRGESPIPVDVSRQQVAAAGGMSIEDVRGIGHEGKALAVMCAGAVEKAMSLREADQFQGVIGLGGSMGTTLGTAVMRSLPVGIPKVMISTMASRDTRAFVGTKDILMLHSVCDLVGLNRVTRRILMNGAMALAGMLQGNRLQPAEPEKPLIFLSTLGTSEACAQILRSDLEAGGNEVVVFHTVGSGGKSMEEMLTDQPVAGLIDLSLHEMADHMFGGDYDAGPDRATVALRKGIPVVLVPGNIDFLVTGPLEKAREQFPGRPYHVHNTAITVVRTSPEEMGQLADRMLDICALARGPVAISIPTGGFSAFGSENGPLRDPDSDKAFYQRLLARLPRHVRVDHLPYDVNHPEFAKLVCWRFLKISGQPG
jgi:uncharacterized protein (UPF0261 family)